MNKRGIALLVCVSAMFAVPKVITRVLLLLELKNPAERVKPLRLRVPWVRVKAPVVPTVNASSKVKVPPETLNPKEENVLPKLVKFCEVIRVGVKLVYVPPDATVKVP
jgi:hypothetical protein